MIPDWMKGNNPQETTKHQPKTDFTKISLDKFAATINTVARTNSAKESDAIGKADSYSFLEANKWFRPTPKNMDLVNHWLKTQGLFDNATFPDFQAATDALASDGLLENVDQVEYVQYLDGVRPRTYKGSNGETYDSLDALISNQRRAALHTVPAPTQEEIDLEHLPIEDVLALCKAGEQAEMARQNTPKTQLNADAFLTNHPEIVDNQRNARLINMQLKANGVTDGVVSIEQFDRATSQLRESGFLTLNKTTLAKQHAAEVKQLAAEHAAIANLTEEDMYALPLEEVRRRADQALKR
jgi:hypothetical protein